MTKELGYAKNYAIHDRNSLRHVGLGKGGHREHF
jgi:hypothetical protein